MMRLSKFLQKQQSPIFYNNIYNLLGFAIPAIVMFAFTPALVKGLGVEDYGIWSLSLSFLGMMGVLEFGLGVSITKFVSEHVAKKDSISLSSTISMGFLINLGLSLMIMIPLYIFAPAISEMLFSLQDSSGKVAESLRIVSFGFMPMMFKNFGLAIPQGLQKYKLVNAIKITQNTLNILIAFLIINQKGSVYYIVFSAVLLMWIIGLTSLYIGYLSIRPYNFHWLISRQSAKSIMSYMSAAGLTNIGIKLFNSVDKLVVGSVLGIEAVTYYSIAIGIANKLVNLSSALSKALMPAASEMQTKGDQKALKKYLGLSSLMMLIINFIIVSGLLVTANRFLAWWLDPDLASVIVGPFCVLILIYGISGITAPAFHIANGIGKPWINAFGTLVQGIGVILLIVVLGPRFGLLGAAWANAISWVKYGTLIYIFLSLKNSGLVREEKPVINN